MAVEAHNLNLFAPQQFIPNREILNPAEGNMNFFNTQMGCSMPLSGTTTETLLPAYNVDCVPVKSESGLTYNLPVQRKRSRDSLTPFLSYKNTNAMPHKNPTSFSFLGEDMSLQIQQQQLEVDRLISQHMAKVRIEVQEKRKRQARRILEAIEFGMTKKLKSKDEEIEKIGKMNWALQEKVKTLCMENQIWRDLAQTSEATANALRTNLEQVLAQVNIDRTNGNCGMGIEDEVPVATAALMDDAHSCCGSNDGGEGGDREVTGEVRILADWAHGKGGSSVRTSKNSSRLCRHCEREEACVLFLPCRHLCLCTVCGSSLDTCPICKSTNNASLHVNLS